ncbi:MAG: very short patch repair endonuclease, partial [Victivallaceae bacterium]
MSRVRSSGNKTTELALIKIFKENKITGWRRKYSIFGKPDFVFPRQKLAIFVDGCFWHGHDERCRIPMSNREYWISKIERNKKRDKLVNETLKTNGWRVLRIWEHEINHSDTANKVEQILRLDVKKRMKKS